MIRYIQHPDIVKTIYASIFKDLGIFREFDAYSATFMGGQLVGKRNAYRCSSKKMFLKISQISQENTVRASF